MDTQTADRPVEEILKAIDGLEVCKAAAHKTLIGIDETIAAEVETLKQALAAGGTTGDRLTDLVVGVCGWQPDFLKVCRDLEEKLKGRKGEFLVVDFEDEVPYKHTFGKGMQSHTKRFFRLGVIDGEELVKVPSRFAGLGTDEVSVPVSNFITFEVQPFFGNGILNLPEPIAGNILSHRYHGGFGSKGNPDSLVKLAFDGMLDPSVRIGDAAVKDWLKARHMEALFKPAAERLRRILPEMIVET